MISAWWLLSLLLFVWPISAMRNLVAFLFWLWLSKKTKGLAKKFCSNMATAHDQMANTQTGGDPDDTISARNGRAYAYGMLVKKGPLWLAVNGLRAFLHRIDPYHCERYALVDKTEGRRALWGYRKLTAEQWAWLKERAGK